MLRGVFAALTAAVFVCVLLVAVASLGQFPDAVARKHRRPSPISVATKPRGVNNALREQSKLRTRRHASTATDSILFPDWEILVIAPSVGDPGDGEHLCLFENNATAPARPAWVLQPGNRSTFICVIPSSVRRRRSILQPALIGSSSQTKFPEPERRPLTMWKFLAYESFSTADDVVVFAKGVNRRQGTNRSPSELNCVFLLGGDVAAKTAVTVSAQEVFRCAHPPALAVPNGDEDARIKVSIEIVPDGNLVVPTAAHYVPARRSPAIQEDKALLCACTMVYKVAKFLREWVTYHSGIGIERFVLYDNGSDDGLEKTVQSLREGGFDVATVLWPWPKTQEAGFSHCALHARDSCTWMAYIDVDEFIVAESSLNSSLPSKQALRSLLPPSGAGAAATNESMPPIGEVTIGCREFGPSEQRAHPPGGVMQGYTCRRRMEQRHKSMVRLDAVHESLLNSIHHFKVKQGFRQKGLSAGKAVVNHYKYQAWPEFKAKFRRRVSAYVVDWRQAVNLASKDRTPGLGLEAVEPKDWAKMFCEVRDERLKKVAERWYGTGIDSGLRMAWQT